LTCSATIIAFWIALPQWHLDTFTPAERAEHYLPVAESICRVARNDNERAFLATQTRFETNMAWYALDERCKDGPPGARCDAGLATGPWQVHAFCRDAWAAPTRAERYDAGARCALRMARQCRTPEGWFASQGGFRRCAAAWARKRVPTFWRILEKLRAATDG
jgi:hypothetical protein